MSGLGAAQRLRRSGCSVVVFEKARGPGGRLCTRRSSSGGFDHGTPYFHAHPSMIDAWIDSGIVAPWKGRFGKVHHDGSITGMTTPRRWVGVPKMSAIGRWMARELDVRTGVRILRLERASGSWMLTDTHDQNYGPFDALVLSCPGPQASALIPQDSSLCAVAKDMKYTVCFAAMLDFNARVPLNWDGIEFNGEPMAHAVRSNSKPGRSAHERWVLHANAGWSEKHQDDAPETVGRALERAFHRWSQSDAVQTTVHRWLYARSIHAQAQHAAIDLSYRLALCGDGMTGGGVVEAIKSGEHVAQLILEIA